MKHFKVIAGTIAAALSIPLAACGQQAVVEHDHVWDTGEVTTEATCHSEGVKTFHCTFEGCKQTKTENIAMLPHNWDEGTVTTQPTCDHLGEMTYTCKNEGCGKTKTSAIAKTDHHFDEGTLEKIPDLLEKGEMEYECTICGETKHEEVDARADFTEQFDLVDSNWIYAYASSFDPAAEAIAPLPMTKVGNVYKEGATEIGRDTVSVNGVAVVGYRFAFDAEDISINASVKFAGETASTRIDAYLLVADATGHVESITAIHKDAKDWEFASTSPITAHKGDLVGLALSGEAKGQLSFTLTAECVHVWSEGKVTKQPDCLHEGEMTYTCVVCGDTKTAPIEKTDHHWGEFVITTPATEDSEGEKTRTCDVCGKTEKEPIPKLNRTIANFHDDFSTDGQNNWLYGYATGFDFDHGDFEFHSLNAGDGEWGGVDGLIIKSDWVLTEADGKDLAIGYVVPEGNTSLDLDISFDAVEAAEGKTRISARTVVIGTDGKAKFCEFVGDGIENASWNKKMNVDVVAGDKVYVVLFKEGPDWLQGKFQMVIKGQKEAPEHGEVPESPYINLTGKVETRFDNEGGTVDLAANSWVAGDGYEAHAEVTTACGERWRAGMFINTGVALEAGKTYEVSFEVDRMLENDYDVVLQNKQWASVDDRYDFLSTPVGQITREITPTEANKGTLWFLVEMGNAVNEVTIRNIKVEEVKEDEPETPAYLNLTDKVETRFDNANGTIELAANSWVAGDGYEAHAEVTTACGERWRAGMFINTGVAVDAGKKYKVSFEVARHQESDYDVILQGKQWASGDERLAFLSSPVGNVEQVIEPTESTKGTLWFLVEMGDAVNEVVIRNIKVEEVKEDEPETPAYLNLTDKVETRFDDEGGTIELAANSWVAGDGHEAHAEVTKACGERWRAGMFINTGVALEAGKSYKVSFVVDRAQENGYDVILQNKKWASGDERIDFLSTPVGEISKEFTVTETTKGTLWFLVEMGDAVNEVTIRNILVEEVTAEEPEQPAYLDFTGKLETRCDNEGGTIDLAANSWVAGDGHEAHAEVTTACGERWRAGMFINTGIALEAGKKYAVAFEVSRMNETGYDVILMGEQWAAAENRLAFLGTPVGEINQEITVTEANAGSLWILVEMGDAVNEVTIRNLVVTEINQ